MAKINQYPAKTVPSNNDEFVLHDPSSGSTKKMIRGDLIGGAPLPPDTVDTQAIADGSVTADKIDFATFGTTDANGWTVLQGYKNRYIRTVTNTDATSTASLSLSPSATAWDLPVGTTSATVKLVGLSAPLGGSFIPASFNASGGTATIRYRNLAASPQTLGSVVTTIELVDV